MSEEQVDLEAVEVRFNHAAQGRWPILKLNDTDILRIYSKEHVAALALSVGDVPLLIAEIRRLRALTPIDY